MQPHEVAEIARQVHAAEQNVVSLNQLILAIIVGMPTLLASIGALVVSLRNGSKIDNNDKLTVATRDEVKESVTKIGSAVKEEAKKDAVKIMAVGMAEAAKKAEQVAVVASEVATKAADKIEEVAKAINGRMSEQLEEARKAAYAEGLLAGKTAGDQAAIIKTLEARQKINSDKIESILEKLNAVLSQSPLLHKADGTIIKDAVGEAIKESGS